MHLASKAILSAITTMEFASNDAPEYIPDDDAPNEDAPFEDSIERDPIATVRALVRVVNYIS